uniref:Uncharacterized protein n=1 Tax=Arundo donax TaxID=35708 RepID=A0A0A9GKA6_ARUDO
MNHNTHVHTYIILNSCILH